MFLRGPTRKKIIVDETRIFNFRDNFVYGDRPVQLQKRISLLEGYLWNPRNFNKSQDIYNFTTMTQQQKKDFFYKYVYATHCVRSINSEGFLCRRKTILRWLFL